MFDSTFGNRYHVVVCGMDSRAISDEFLNLHGRVIGSWSCSGNANLDTCLTSFVLKKGYAMVKLFGFMLAVAAMVSGANAALLVSYEFGVDQEKDPTFVEPGIDALPSDGAFSHNEPNERIQSSVSNTSTVRQERFGFSTTAPNFIKLRTMTFDSASISGTRPVSITPSFKYNQVAVASSLYTVSPVSGFGSYTVTFLSPFEIAGGVDFEAAISAQGLAGSGTTSFAVDNVKFNGDLVPEPASMAIFGLLGVGAAARRFRRKK